MFVKCSNLKFSTDISQCVFGVYLASQVNVLVLVIQNREDQIKKNVASVYIAQFPENAFVLFSRVLRGN